MVSQMVIGPGRVNFRRRVVWARVNRTSCSVHRARPAQRTGDGRDLHHVAVVPDPHPGLAVPVDPLERLEKAVHEVHAELLAVGDDVDPGVLELLDPQESGVLLRAIQRFTLELPGRPEGLGLGEPRGLGKAAGNRGFEHDGFSGGAHVVRVGRDVNSVGSKACPGGSPHRPGEQAEGALRPAAPP